MDEGNSVFASIFVFVFGTLCLVAFFALTLSKAMEGGL